MGNKPEYWSELPTLLPGRYKHRTALSKAFTLQVSGSCKGERQKVILYRITPEGRLVRTWSETFFVHKNTAPRSAKFKALHLFLDAAKNDPKVAGRLAVQDIIDAARGILANY